MYYPRILIVGQSFNNYTGGGITLKNLFLNWPDENIAIISGRKNEDWSICRLQYVIGNDETAKCWPFSLLQEQTPSHIIRKEEKQVIDITKASIPVRNTNKSFTIKQILRNLIKKILNFFGIFLFISKTKMSKNLSEFVEEFNPEVIYSQLSTLELINLVEEIHVKYKIPIAIHIMDDWPITINREGLLGYYWNKRTNKAFHNLIDKSSMHLSICDAMSIEYNRRYGKNWLAFHNPIDIMESSNSIQSKKVVNSCLYIMYRGRLGTGIKKGMIFLIKTIEDMVNSGHNIKLQLGIEEEEYNKIRLKQYKCTELLSKLPYSEVHSSLASADLLVIVYDFDIKLQEYVKFSMPTKATEYMASGVPILVFAPPDHAVTQYARSEDWGYVVDTEDQNLLQSGIIDLLYNKKIRERFISNAKHVVRKNHDAEKVREKFRNALSFCKN